MTLCNDWILPEYCTTFLSFSTLLKVYTSIVQLVNSFNIVYPFQSHHLKLIVLFYTSPLQIYTLYKSRMCHALRSENPRDCVGPGVWMTTIKSICSDLIQQSNTFTKPKLSSIKKSIHSQPALTVLFKESKIIYLDTKTDRRWTSSEPVGISKHSHYIILLSTKSHSEAVSIQNLYQPLESCG
jgi:hypothetical protein